MRFNPILESFESYVPGEQPGEGRYVKLNTNECPYPPAPEVAAAVEACLAKNALNKYPDPTCTALRKAIGERLDVAPEWIFVGNGSDEVLRLLCHALLAPGDATGMLYPTYVLYRTLAAMFGARCVEFDTSAPSHDIPQLAFSTPTQILFLANPNPPLGTLYPLEAIEALANAQPQRLVVVDEAYVDFAGHASAVDLVKRVPNIAVTRTFSKSYALAGMRAGFVIARRELIEQISKLKDSYNVNRITQAAALSAWQARSYYEHLVAAVCATRSKLEAELRLRGFAVPSSAGNFVFARRADAAELYRRLRERKVLVRYFNMRLLTDGVRITVGTREDIVALLKAIDELDGRIASH
jgi:histidinol-phosphate aminotransferase